MISRKQLLCAATIAAGIPVSTAIASTQTTTFQVTATVQTACEINSASNLAFGAYTRQAIDDATSNISVTCTNTTPYDVGLDAGTSTGATVTNRAMTGPGGALLHYAMYSDANRTVNWGNTVGVDTVHSIGNGSAQSLTVYGQIPSGQHPTPGAYTDTITVTLTF